MVIILRFNIDKLNAIGNWQESDMHKLTCGECGEIVYGDILDVDVFLTCIKGHIQTHVPQVVYDRYEKLLEEERFKYAY